MTTPQAVLEFWLERVGPEGWYAGGAEIDALCAREMGAAVAAARAGAYLAWLGRPESALAYLILTDQIPRNIGRGTPLAFASDARARAAADLALAKGHDRGISGIERQFFYLPFEHAETCALQDRSVRLFLTRMPDDPYGNLSHALAHRAVIRRFGRFPDRNRALGRESSPAETVFLAEGGYAAEAGRWKEAAMQAVQGAAAAGSLQGAEN